MGVKLVSASAGSVEIVAPTTASNFTATLPAGTGTMVVNGVNSSIVSGTAVASTSGTSVTFTSIPSWVKRITVMFNGVSTNSTNKLQLQIGSGSIDITGYSGSVGSRGAEIYNSTGFNLAVGVTAAVNGYSIATLATLGSNIWVVSGTWASSATDAPYWFAGGKTLSGTLDQLRIIASATGSPSDTFDLGSINILYE